MASMVALLPLPSGGSLALWFNAVNLPLCILNSVRLQRRGPAVKHHFSQPKPATP
jgi:hypothetical protein